MNKKKIVRFLTDEHGYKGNGSLKSVLAFCKEKGIELTDEDDKDLNLKSLWAKKRMSVTIKVTDKMDHDDDDDTIGRLQRGPAAAVQRLAPLDLLELPLDLLLQELLPHAERGDDALVEDALRMLTVGDGADLQFRS